MSYDQHQAPPPVYPPPPTAYPPPGQVYPRPAEAYPPTYAAPPPAGYPVYNDATAYPEKAPVETKDRGNGFWKGCCAALCCCCLLDMCF